MVGMGMIALGDRSEFPDLVAEAYLNHAAISPPSSPVRAATQAVVDSYASAGAGAFGRWLEQRKTLRGQIAQLIGAAADDIAFVANTTRGVTDVALCLPWKRGDRVLLSRGEFPANVTPWQQAAAVHGLEIVWLEQPTAASMDAWLAALSVELERGARLLAVSAVQFQTGLRMPLDVIAERCRDAGCEVFVDAIQACGAVPVSAAHADYIACGSHKWLMGTEGVAFLYIAPERIAALRPLVAGWLSHEDAFSFLFEGPDRLRYDRPIRRQANFVEGGISNSIGCAALGASVAILESIGVDAIFAHVNAYLNQLEPRLTALGLVSQRASDPALRSGILSLALPAGVDIAAFFERLDGKCVACATPDGFLRLAPHWPNHPREIDTVVAAIEAALP